MNKLIKVELKQSQSYVVLRIHEFIHTNINCREFLFRDTIS